MIAPAFFASLLISQSAPISGLPNIPELREWIQKFGSPSPVQAINKTVSEPFQISDEHLQQVLKGKTNIRYSKPFIVEGQNVLEFDVFEEDQARRFELSDTYNAADDRIATNALSAQQSEKRFSYMLEQFYKLLSDRKDDELLLVLMGRMHAYDVYLNFFLQDPDKIRRNSSLQRRREIIYVNYPLNENMRFKSDDYYALLRALDGVDTPTKFVSANAAYIATAFLGRLHYFNDLKKDAITLSSLKDETLSRLGVIVFMDLHHLDSPAAFRSMPTADSLRRAGYKSVKVAVEPWMAQKSYDINEFNRLYRTPHAFSMRDYELQFLQKRNPKIKRRYLDGDLVMNPNLAIFHEKLKAYKRGGLSVSLTGLEEKEISP